MTGSVNLFTRSTQLDLPSGLLQCSRELPARACYHACHRPFSVELLTVPYFAEQTDRTPSTDVQRHMQPTPTAYSTASSHTHDDGRCWRKRPRCVRCSWSTSCCSGSTASCRRRPSTGACSGCSTRRTCSAGGGQPRMITRQSQVKMPERSAAAVQRHDRSCKW